MSAVILSGAGSDGTAALRGIKEIGGMVFAQNVDTAETPDMPQHAIESGCVDFIGSPEDIGREIGRIVKGHQSKGRP